MALATTAVSPGGIAVARNASLVCQTDRAITVERKQQAAGLHLGP
jgi:hypothetical protein